jgi:hypothetical protein
MIRLYAESPLKTDDHLPTKLAFENGQVFLSRDDKSFPAGTLGPLY